MFDRLSNLENGTAITVLNPHNSRSRTYKAVADCAQMNPVTPIIAVKGKEAYIYIMHFNV